MSAFSFTLNLGFIMAKKKELENKMVATTNFFDAESMKAYTSGCPVSDDVAKRLPGFVEESKEDS